MMRSLLAAMVLCTSAEAHEFSITISRVVDADTFDGQAQILPTFILDGRFRLMCINAPEKWTDTGRAMRDAVASWDLRHGTVEIFGQDAFGRYLAFITPLGWSETINARLHRMGAPLYARLTKAQREMCEGRL